MTQIRHLGHHFLVGLGGPTLSEKEAQLLQELSPIGIILFSHNVDGNAGDAWPEALIDLIDRAKEASGRERFLVSIDHEGGRVHRLPPPVTHFPAAVHWGGSAQAVASAMASELRALGVNLSFAPVLDVLSAARSQVIGDRAFGDDPALVSNKALKFMSGLHEEGVLSCGKHFPGHGCVVADSHFELPVCKDSEDVLCARDLVPFQDLIANGLPMVMTAHVRYQFLDSEFPATLSKTVLLNLLREKVGFEGVVISDDMEMRALEKLAPGDSAVQALQAGIDILLIGKSSAGLPLEKASEMAQTLDLALNNSTLPGDFSLFTEQRIERLFEFLDGITPSESQPSWKNVLGSTKHRELSKKIEAGKA